MKTRPTFPEEFEVFNPGYVVHDIDHAVLHNLNHPLFKKIIATTDQVVCIINHSTLEYQYLSENIDHAPGQPHKEWIKKGVANLISKLHPDDMAILNQIVFPGLYKDLLSLPTEDRLRFRCSYTYRLKNLRHQYVSVLQNNIILTMENDKIILGPICSDITAFKKNSAPAFKTSWMNDHGEFITISQHTPGKIDFTIQELKVLERVSKGYSEKQIADELSLSLNTIKTHKKI